MRQEEIRHEELGSLKDLIGKVSARLVVETAIKHPDGGEKEKSCPQTPKE